MSASNMSTSKKSPKLLLVALVCGLVAVPPAAFSADPDWQNNPSDTNEIYYDSGNVGIGTSNPADLFHVYGASNPAIRLAGGAYRGQWAMATSNGAYSSLATTGAFVLRNVSGGDMVFAANQSGGFRFGTQTPNVERMTILSDGKVGIGTSTPQTELAVNGTITAKEVDLAVTGWPDYVFADGYDLTPLDELEARIESEGHLPGMPSAEEAARDGVGVGEMQTRLLEKIEELTLYMIELRKENDELRSRLDALEVLE